MTKETDMAGAAGKISDIEQALQGKGQRSWRVAQSHDIRHRDAGEQWMNWKGN